MESTKSSTYLDNGVEYFIAKSVARRETASKIFGRTGLHDLQ